MTNSLNTVKMEAGSVLKKLIFADFDKSENFSTCSNGCICCWVCKQTCQCEFKIQNFFVHI